MCIRKCCDEIELKSTRIMRKVDGLIKGERRRTFAKLGLLR